MFKRILIADRGEIAVRIIRTCRDLGIVSVAIYSEVDRDAMYALIADEAICIGPAEETESYLNTERILAAACAVHADAIHPGCGLLSKSVPFADAVKQYGMTFIGPSADSIHAAGNQCKIFKIAHDIGIPIITDADDLMMEAPHKIAFQVLGDTYGQVVHLFERDGSYKARNQKLLTESPSPFLTEELRSEMGEAAVRLAKAIGYFSIGTVDFLVDGNGRYYFVEMHPSIQTEHSVTEAVTGFDLVVEQIRMAAGQPLGYVQKDIVLWGHAIECHINAGDVSQDFGGRPGCIHRLNFPSGPGVRVDAAVYQDYEMPLFCDSLLVKIIVHGLNRSHALSRARRAMAELKIEGIPTTTDILCEILYEPSYG
jgi:acetyl-CoA carboxylase biotin carboxylase subunit